MTPERQNGEARETAVVREWVRKHTSMATKYTIIEELL
jgi:hypothetical protein